MAASSKQGEKDAGPTEEEDSLFSVSCVKNNDAGNRGTLTAADGMATEKASPKEIPLERSLFKTNEEYNKYLAEILKHREEKGRVLGLKEGRPSFKENLFHIFSACITVLWVWQTLVWGCDNDLEKLSGLVRSGLGVPEHSSFGAAAYDTHPWVAHKLFPIASPLPVVHRAYPPAGGCVRVNGSFNSTGDNEIVASLVHHAKVNGFGAFSAPRLDRPYCALISGFTLMLNPEIVMVNTGSVLEAEETAPLTCPDTQTYRLTRSSHVMVRYQNAAREWLLLEVKDLETAWALQSEIAYLNRGLSPCNGDIGLPTTIETLTNKF